jgi:hypothetical protein
VTKTVDDVVALTANTNTRYLRVDCPTTQTTCRIQDLSATFTVKNDTTITAIPTATAISIPGGGSAFIDVRTPSAVTNGLDTTKSGSVVIYARVAGAGALTEANRRFGIRRAGASSSRTPNSGKPSKAKASKSKAKTRSSKGS